MTQKQLADKLEISIQQLNNTISGRNTASMAVYERIADALGVEFWQMFAPDDVLNGVILPTIANGEITVHCSKCGNEIKVKFEQ